MILIDEVREVEKSGDRPRVHGNGFIQLDLQDNRRLHVWGDYRIPRQIIPSPIHDHTFSFMSTIIKGQLVNRSMNVRIDSGGGFDLYVAKINEKEDTHLEKQSYRVSVEIQHEILMKAEQQYTFPAGAFHETVAPWKCVTVIDKVKSTKLPKPAARVLVPVGLEPDNTFNRYDADPKLLWQIIYESLRQW